MASHYYWGLDRTARPWVVDQVDPAGLESLGARRSSLTLVLDQVEAYPHRPSSGAWVTPSSDPAAVGVYGVVGYDVNVLITWERAHYHCATYVGMVAGTFQLLEVFAL